jgi:protoporphyrinogen oxidase
VSDAVILGGGVTGLAAGVELLRRSGRKVLLIEKEERVGGLAATVDLDGWGADLGSHRIHENYDPRALELIRSLIGPDLLTRVRRGRVRVAGKFIDYPPNLLTLLAGIGGARSVRAAADYLRRGKAGADNFKARAESAVGGELYRLFYHPYAVKLWGIDPSLLAADPAAQRTGKLGWRRLLSEAARLVRRRPASYLYPRHGIGQIAAALRAEFIRLGGTVHTSSEVTAIQAEDGHVTRIEFRQGPGADGNGVSEVRGPRTVINTLPLRRTCRLLGADQAMSGLRYRSLRILYLLYPAAAATPHETYYIPDPDFRIGRVSRPAAYSAELAADPDRALFTVEMPCSEGDAVWTAGDGPLVADCHRELTGLGILPAGTGLIGIAGSARIPDLYPVHTIGWKDRLGAVLGGAVRSSGSFPAGRSALFLHCNIDHCVLMGTRLARHIADGGGAEAWLRTVQDECFGFEVKD